VLPSLANHVCDPNLDAVWLDGDATITLRARRDIAAGEELRITYIDSTVPVAERRETLRFGYGFDCACPACTEELADGAA
jgi:SET and MYND domain-containing protein